VYTFFFQRCTTSYLPISYISCARAQALQAIITVIIISESLVHHIDATLYRFVWYSPRQKHYTITPKTTTSTHLHTSRGLYMQFCLWRNGCQLEKNIIRPQPSKICITSCTRSTLCKSATVVNKKQHNRRGHRPFLSDLVRLDWPRKSVRGGRSWSGQGSQS
jgi:hypothetical protein